MERARTSFNGAHQNSITTKDVSIRHVKEINKKWRFRPRSIWPFVMWGLVLFVGFKITIIPLIEGVYYFVASTSEIHQLKNQYITMQKQLGDIRKQRDYMKTPSFVEEKAHEIGLVKSEESQMVVADGASDDTSLDKKNSTKKKVRN